MSLLNNPPGNMTVHAMEEMDEDNLDILDVEQAVLTGEILRFEKGDARGTKYVVEGLVANHRAPVAVVGRFTTNGRYLIMAVYEKSDSEE